MEQDLVLKTEKRSYFGTRMSRKIRSQGLIPCVVYGKGIDNLHLMVRRRDLEKIIRSGRHLIDIKDPDGNRFKVLIKDIQYDHLFKDILHIDFHKVALTEYVEVEVPLLFKGTPTGVSEEAGVFEEFVKSIRIKCLPTHIPEKIEIDVTGLKLKERLHIKDLPLPKEVKVLIDPETVIAAVYEPRVVEEAPAPEEVAPAPSEPEVIKKERREEEPEK
jgi:large subunit ribosomal protein L25